MRGIVRLVIGAALCRLCPSRTIKGIRVLEPVAENPQHFVEVVSAALALIAERDPVRFARVRAQVRWIMNMPSLWGFDYFQPLRICQLDLRVLEHAFGAEMTVRFAASALVHGATLGHLVSRGVLRTPLNMHRFDEVRRRQAQGFMHTLGMETTPWDPGRMRHLPSGVEQRVKKRAVREILARKSGP